VPSRVTKGDGDPAGRSKVSVGFASQRGPTAVLIAHGGRRRTRPGGHVKDHLSFQGGPIGINVPLDDAPVDEHALHTAGGRTNAPSPPVLVGADRGQFYPLQLPVRIVIKAVTSVIG